MTENHIKAIVVAAAGVSMVICAVTQQTEALLALSAGVIGFLGVAVAKGG